MLRLHLLTYTQVGRHRCSCACQRKAARRSGRKVQCYWSGTCYPTLNQAPGRQPTPTTLQLPPVEKGPPWRRRKQLQGHPPTCRPVWCGPGSTVNTHDGATQRCGNTQKGGVVHRQGRNAESAPILRTHPIKLFRRVCMQSGVVVMNSHRGPVVHSTPVGTGPSPQHSSSHLPRHTALEAGEHRCSHPRREAPCTRGKVHSAPCAAGGVSCPDSTQTLPCPMVASPRKTSKPAPGRASAQRSGSAQCRACAQNHANSGSGAQTPTWRLGAVTIGSHASGSPPSTARAGSSPSPTCLHLHHSCFRVSKA